jgi:hypothetical protein
MPIPIFCAPGARGACWLCDEKANFFNLPLFASSVRGWDERVPFLPRTCILREMEVADREGFEPSERISDSQ